MKIPYEKRNILYLNDLLLCVQIYEEIYAGIYIDRKEKMMNKEYYLVDSRFKGIEPFNNKIWLSSPTMHGYEQKWVDEAIRTNWVSTVGANINEVERMIADKVGRKYAVALSSGTAALHLAVKLCGEAIYGQPKACHGTLEGKKVIAV